MPSENSNGIHNTDNSHHTHMIHIGWRDYVITFSVAANST